MPISLELLEKADRLIKEQRVTLLEERSGANIPGGSQGIRKATFAVEGEHSRYIVTLWDDCTGFCSCPAQLAPCSHFAAAWRVWQGPDRLDELIRMAGR